MEKGIKHAKELFLNYNGNRFYMDMDGKRQEYDSYGIPRETENAWRKEYLSLFPEQKKSGKEALRAYSKAADFLESGMTEDDWKRILEYPLRAEGLDDVTVLLMLQVSFHLAERGAEKGKISRETADEYLHALDEFSRNVLKRAEAGAVTRDSDYTMQEFADEEVTADFLKNLRRKWTKLTRVIRR